MKRILLTMAAALTALVCSAQSVQEQYIEKFAPVAVAEMHRSGVPASITLAQGLLESGSGRSTLAVKGNNHFGIKCHSNWKGATIHADDDRRNECFRSYKSADESFRDHSDFLRYSDRYKFLFELDRTDYKGWAYGLKQAGYATDPSYASKLIKYVEDYNLSRFDSLSPEEEAALPESPLKIEEPVVMTAESSKGSDVKASELFRFSLSRQLYAQNGVPFVYASAGETYRSIAKSYHLFLREILRYNDLSKEAALAPGTVVYLQPKKKAAPKGLDKYIVAEDGEVLRDICQRFALRESAVKKLNGFSGTVTLREGDEIKLR
ncbi:MAG: glucosaminidase domain-containing protein [Bacteroidales bacterium]|nr:glucosaminidase domain-containing protein [Bacteroidales bacterium]